MKQRSLSENRDSALRKVTCYGLDNRISISGNGYKFSLHDDFRTTLGTHEVPLT